MSSKLLCEKIICKTIRAYLPLKIAKEDNTDVDKEELLCCNDEHTDLEDKELNLRVAALEVELIKIKAKLFQSKNESL